MDKNFLEFLDLLSKKEIVIYGAGYVAKKLFYKALVERGLAHNVKCFCVTNANDRNDVFCGIPIISVQELKISKESIICIAVHASVKDEIFLELNSKGIDNYIWVYPYLFQLLLGEAAVKNVGVNVNDIVRQTCNDDYGIVLRYAMIEYHFGKNDWGFELYVKSREQWASKKNAVIRARNFCRLIDDWKRDGYDSRKRICIFDNFEVFDGAHRVALAKYFNQESIFCDIWKKSIELADLYGKDSVSTKDNLLQCGFNLEEIRKLEELKEKMCNH